MLNGAAPAVPFFCGGIDMKKYLPLTLGILFVGGIVLYQRYRHLSGIVLLETAILGIAAVLGVLHLIRFWRDHH